jgi:hypothetical protein
MKTNTQNLTPNDPASLASIVRSLDEGPNYQPDWRWLFVQEHLAEIHDDDDKTGDPSVKLAQILDREKDEIIRKTLEFLCSASSGNDEAVEYALRTHRTPEAAIKIKAMVVANGLIELIASHLGTQPAKIEFFEKLFVDVRGCLDNRDWLETICRGPGGHRLLEVAFDRGWAGVEEVLQHLPKGPRDLSPIISVFLGRSQRHARNLEAYNVPTSEKDQQMLLSVLHAKNTIGQSPVLEDPVEPQPLPDTETSKKVAKLTPVGRDRVRVFLQQLLDEAERKAAEQDLAASNGSDCPPPNPEEAPPLEPQ